ncbi:MAG: ATP-binding cassette domain-containing protein [Deltaproteobacteria bacterium]|nr:ATP-binding cassette domain-containing protein [Deltaproteobacteria bacterium]
MIEVKDLRLSYGTDHGRVTVLKGASFSIRKGEKVAICGPSGSGKSTLLYILGGLLAPDSGVVNIGRMQIWNESEETRAKFRSTRVGFVFQSFHLIPGWTVLQNVLLGSEYQVSAVNLEDRAMSILKKLGIADLSDREPNQLSGGQAQRVAIARALLMNPDLILADEPTGALDSSTAHDILRAFDEINAEGKTVVIITHDEQIASSCDRVIRIRDGTVVGHEEGSTVDVAPAFNRSSFAPLDHSSRNWFSSAADFLRSYSPRKSFKILKRSPSRSLLTLFGIAVGVAAVVSMISVGRFAKERILESYGTLGVRNFKVWGYPNWRLSASKPLESYFREIQIQDLETVKTLFPEIRAYSPMARYWGPEISFLGKTISQDLNMLGVNEYGIGLNQYEIDVGRPLTVLDMEDRNSVCVMGSGLADQLGVQRGMIASVSDKPLVFIKNRNMRFACRLVGLLKHKKSSGEGRWDKPGFELFLPHTFLRAVRGESTNSNEGDLNQVLFEVKEGVIPDILADRVKEHFVRKYGEAGDFRAEANAKVINQMRKFLEIFNFLLIGIAFVTLIVGASGVTNMILVSLSERLRELGIRRAVGANSQHLRQLVIGESLTLCLTAGFVGLVFALGGLHIVLYFTSLIFPKVPFEWVFDPLAIGISLIAILGVGILSGLYPALRVEKLDVVSALRSDG